MTDQQNAEAEMLEHCSIQVAREGKCEIVPPAENKTQLVELPTLVVPESD